MYTSVIYASSPAATSQDDSKSSDDRYETDGSREAAQPPDQHTATCGS